MNLRQEGVAAEQVPRLYLAQGHILTLLRTGENDTSRGACFEIECHIGHMSLASFELLAKNLVYFRNVSWGLGAPAALFN